MVYNMLVIFSFYFIPFICWFIGAKIRNNFIPSAGCWRIAALNPSPAWWRISSTSRWRFVFGNWSATCWPYSRFPIGHQVGDLFGQQAVDLFQQIQIGHQLIGSSCQQTVDPSKSIKTSIHPPKTHPISQKTCIFAIGSPLDSREQPPIRQGASPIVLR